MGFISSFLALFISAPTITTVYAANENTVILDVRTPSEFSSNHIKGAINIDFYGSDFETKIKALDKNKDYKVYCRSGNRSGQTVNLMKKLGFKEVENVGGITQAAKKINLVCEKDPC